MSKVATFDDQESTLAEALGNELPSRPAGRPATRRKKGWFQVLRPLTPRARLALGVLSFVLPITIWCIVSYVPFVWHPQVEITNAGSIDYLQVGMRMNKKDFANIVAGAKSEHKAPPEGISSNPIYLPAPLDVAKAMYTAFITPPPTIFLNFTSARSGSTPVVSQSIMKPMVPVGAKTVTWAFR